MDDNAKKSPTWTMPMSQLRFFILSVGSLLLASCAGVSVMQDYSPTADFSNLRTWDWLSAESRRIDLKVRDQRIEGIIRASIESELGTKGLRKETSGEPSFRVTYLLVLEEGLESQTINEYAGGSWTYRQYGPPITMTYGALEQVGSLIIDIYDVETKELIWRGAGQAKVHRTQDADERRELAEEAVRKILEQFPPSG